MTSVVVVRDRPTKPFFYAIDHYVSYWRSIGYEVIDHVGPHHVPDADVLVFHVDYTILPLEYRSLCERFPVVINGDLLDISRRQYSQLILTRTDVYAGPVIVKTNTNYGGWPEHVLDKTGSWKQRLAQWWTVEPLPPCLRFDDESNLSWRRKMRLKNLVKRTTIAVLQSVTAMISTKKARHWRTLRSLHPLRYPIFENMESVPPDVWDNDHLVVERFLPDYEDGLFYINYFVFFGGKEFSGRMGAVEPIVKFSNSVTDQTVPVPDVIRECRTKMKADFGRIDYVHDGNDYFVIDVNKTEGGGMSNHEVREELNFLASGLETFLNPDNSSSNELTPA